MTLSDTSLPSTGVSMAQMRTVLQVSRALAVTVDLDALLHRIAEATTALLGCERASIFLHDAKHDELWSKVALGSDEIRLPAGQGIAGHAFRHNAVIHVPDAYADPRFIAEFDRRSGFRTRNLLAAPMVDWDVRPVGVVQALNKSSGDFSECDASLLRLVADQAGVALQRWRLQQAAIQSTSLRHEMELARRVQEAATPQAAPDIPGLRAAGWMQPSSINGGDCYDLWQLSNGELGVLVADASGHGLPAALVISQARALVRTLSEIEREPIDILRRINRRFAQDLGRGRFVTMFLAFIAPDGLLRWCSAGQGPILLAQNQKFQSIDANLPPLGILAELPSESPAPVRLQSGDGLVVPSDGIVEAFNASEEMFGVERLTESLRSSPIAQPSEAIARMRAAVESWQGKPEPADDQTLVIVCREG